MTHTKTHIPVDASGAIVVIAQNTLTCGVQEFGIKLSIFQVVDLGGPPKIHPSILGGLN